MNFLYSSWKNPFCENWSSKLSKSTCSVSEMAFLFNWHHQAHLFLYSTALTTRQNTILTYYSHYHSPRLRKWAVYNTEHCALDSNDFHFQCDRWTASNISCDFKLILGIILLTDCQNVHQIGLKMQNDHFYLQNDNLPHAENKHAIYICIAFIALALHSRCAFQQFMQILGIKPMTLMLLAPYSTVWATGTLYSNLMRSPDYILLYHCLKNI